MAKNILILRASEDIPDQEIDNVKAQVELYAMEVTISSTLTVEQVKAALYAGVAYDYIYLATHGCEANWGSVSGALEMTWIQFAAEVCKSGVSKPGAVFLHSCCRGGLDSVAYDMFACCEKIELVCGPRFNVRPADLVMAFNLFLYNIEVRGTDPIVSAQKVLAAIDLRLHCMDRIECLNSINYQHHCELRQDQIEDAFRTDFELLDRERDRGRRPPEILPEVEELFTKLESMKKS